MEHFEHCANLVGIDHVASGPDTHFGDHVAWHHAYSDADIQKASGLNVRRVRQAVLGGA